MCAQRKTWGGNEGEERMTWNRKNERDEDNIVSEKMNSVDSVM